MNPLIIPKPVVDIIGEVVAEVNTRILAQLQVAEPKIKTIQYLYGHPQEIIETLRQESQSPTLKFKKFPCIMLFQDITEKYGKPYALDLNSLHIVIATSTMPTYKASERYAKTFRPILYPIYMEFKKRLCRHPSVINLYSERGLQHNKMDRLSWGKQGIYGTMKGMANEYLDAIEITNLSITINFNNILQPTTQIDGQ
jgi:hypothetical protein